MRDELTTIRQNVNRFNFEQAIRSPLPPPSAAEPPAPEPAPSPPSPPNPPPAAEPESGSLSIDLAVGEVVECPYRGAPLNGILRFLETKCGGNPHDKALIVVSASGCLDSSRFDAKNAANVDANTAFVSLNQPNQWICYDFKDKRITLSHYSIRSRFDGFRGSNNPKDWVVEGSETGDDWIELDRQTNNEDLNSRNVAKAWELKSGPPLRYVRLRQIGRAHSRKHYLAISSFELFGSLSKPDE
jgi:hypothetical protein